MTKAEKGAKVKVHYTGKLDDGTVFGSSANSNPVEFAVGEHKVISGFEEAVEGMRQGEKKTFKIPPEKAYGPRNEGALFKMPRNKVPAEISPQVGQQLSINKDGGGSVSVRVAQITDQELVLDANHPLAGKNLTFDIELIEVA